MPSSPEAGFGDTRSMASATPEGLTGTSEATVAVPESALVARGEIDHVPVSAADGVHASVPVVSPVPTVNVA